MNFYKEGKDKIKNLSFIEPIKKELMKVDGRISEKLGKDPEFVITGTGRCGTVFLANLIDKLGIPCRHEYFYEPEGYSKRIGVRGDVSWMAVPFLKDYKGPVVHLVRHPVKVINALVSAKAFDKDRLDNRYVAFMNEHFPLSGDQIKDAMRFYVEWNREIEKHAAIRVRLEDISDDLPKLLKAVGIKCPKGYQEVLQLMPPMNSRSEQVVTLKDLPEGWMMTRLNKISREYGYDLQKVSAS